MKIAIVNDLKIAQEILKQVIATVPDYELIWIAWDGQEAIDKTIRDTPDIILMDLIMPNINGVEATKQIMEKSPCAILVVTATVEGNANLVYEAMGYGAIDAVKTPTFDEKGNIIDGPHLLEKIQQIGRIIGKITPPPPTELFLPKFTETDQYPEVVLIGASTGGPQALLEIFSQLPQNFPVPIIVVQHVDQEFANGLATWLNNSTLLDVQIATDGTKPEKGKIYIAATKDHLVYTPTGLLHYTPDPLDVIYRPSVNVLFKSYATHSKSNGIAIILTGMSQDGAEGLLMLRNKGWLTIAQDKESSILFSMPKAAIELHAATQILPLSEISKVLTKFTKIQV